MPAVGTATLSFGAAPGSSEVSVVVAAATIPAGAKVEAYFQEDTTTDNDAQMHRQAAALISLVCGSVVASTSFTITGYVLFGRAIGDFKVQWVHS